MLINDIIGIIIHAFIAIWNVCDFNNIIRNMEAIYAEGFVRY